jgi:hypothetical protein
LAGWGFARARRVRGLQGVVRVRPRRARCTGCGVTHVLLPVGLLLRRADAVVVIGAALQARAAGVGWRRIAAGLGRPAETVRGWLRRFAGRLEAVRQVFTVLLRAVAADPVMPPAAGGAWADAVSAVGAAVAALVVRFGRSGTPGGVLWVPPWWWVSALCGGRLLAPGWPAWPGDWPAEWINTS